MKNKYIIGLLVLVVVGVIVFISSKNEIKDDGVLTVGVSVPLTGPTAQYGEIFKSGLESGLADAKNIKVIYEDSKGDAAPALAAFQKLTTVDNVDVVVSVVSKATIALVPVAKQNKIPMIASLTAAPGATSKDNEYVYRIFWTAKKTGELFANRIIAQNIKSVGLLQAKDEASQSNADVIVPILQNAGIKVVVETFQGTDTDYRTQLTKLKKEKLEVLGIISIPAAQWKGITAQMREVGLTLPTYDVLGALLNPGAPEAVGALAEGVYTLTTPFNMGDYKADFRNDYIKKNGREPLGFESFGFDIATLLKQLATNNATSRRSVLDYLKALKSFEGVSSPYTMDDSHDFVADVIKGRLMNGKIVKSDK